MRVPSFNAKKSIGKLKLCWNKNNQIVLAVMAGGFAIAAVVSAVKAGPKAEEIKAKRAEKIDDLAEELKDTTITNEEFKKEQKNINIEFAKDMAICYGPTAVSLTFSLASIAIGYKVSIGKQAALIASYKALESRSAELEAKAREIFGDTKVDNLKHEIVKDHMGKSPMPEDMKRSSYETDDEGNYVAKTYKYPCYDFWSGDYFDATTTMIDQAMMKASLECRKGTHITIGEIYDIINDITGECRLGKGGYGDNDGFTTKDLDPDGMIPYSVSAIMRDGFECPVTYLYLEPKSLNLE